MRAVPIARNSRLHPIHVKSKRWPVILNEDGSMDPSGVKRVCKILMEGRSMNYDKYRITLKYNNEKFSTKVYGS